MNLLKVLRNQFSKDENDYYPGHKNKTTKNGVTVDNDLLGRILVHKYQNRTFTPEQL